MLTKYVAFMYFRVPYSHDPTSIMHQPLTPNGGPDDLYESDLHSEESANGFWERTAVPVFHLFLCNGGNRACKTSRRRMRMDGSRALDSGRDLSDTTEHWRINATQHGS